MRLVYLGIHMLHGVQKVKGSRDGSLKNLNSLIIYSSTMPMEGWLIVFTIAVVTNVM